MRPDSGAAPIAGTSRCMRVAAMCVDSVRSPVLMAQGWANPEVSALMGSGISMVWPVKMAEEHGVYGVTAGDIAANIGKAIQPIMKPKTRYGKTPILPRFLLLPRATTAGACTITGIHSRASLNEYGLVLQSAADGGG